MKVKNLKLIYKYGIVSNVPSDDIDHYNYFDGETYLYLSKEKLSDNEVLLLDSMKSDFVSDSKWHDFLINSNATQPQEVLTAQCIHFHVSKLLNNKTQWLNSFESYFENVYDTFFIDKEYGVIVIDQYNKESDELEGFISMLDDDFSTLTSVFVGVSSQIQYIQDIFKEEQTLFKKNIKIGHVINFIDVYLPTYMTPQLEGSFVSQQIKQAIENDAKLIELIKMLWENQGNLSSTSKALFMHRNTLNYRIDKLLNDYDLNLRDTQELLLCYLLVI